MNQNYNIKLNPKQPSSEDIAKHQDFDALFAQFQATTPVETPSAPRRSAIIRRLVYVGSAAAAVLVGILFFVGLNSGKTMKQYQAEQEKYFAAQPFVKPPIPAAKAQFASHKINANEGGVYKFGNGSRLVIPAETFQNDRGEMIQGEVDIRIKEYHDFVDFFLSGIPMTYDSAGVVYNLESAGMIEIYAEQGGQRVKIASGKSIDVELVSSIIVPDVNVPPHYNIYKLDTENKKWVYQDIDNIQVMEDDFSDLKTDDPMYEAKKNYVDELASIAALEAQELTRIEASLPKPPMPARPQTRNGDMPSLELDFLDDLSGEADSDSEAIRQQYDGKVWQLSPSSPPLDGNAANVTWEDFKLIQLNDRDFELTLLNLGGNKQLKLIINPVLSGTEYDDAMSNYDAKLAEYNKLVEEREVALEAKKQLLTKRIAEQKAIAQTTLENNLTTSNTANNNNIIKRKVVNRFKASSFGIWNCDRPIPPEIYQLDATFVGKDGKEFNNHTAFLVDKHRNTVARFYATKGAKLRFNANSDNLLWVVTDDNKIAVFRPEDFKRINRKKGDYTFNLDVIDEQIDNEKEVRKILSF